MTIEARANSGAYNSAIVQKELDRVKKQVSTVNFKVDDSPSFQIQVASGQLEEPIATAKFNLLLQKTLVQSIFVVMKKLTEPIVGLHIMRHNSVVMDTTHGLFYFPHLTMQA